MKSLGEMTLAELWELFPIFLVPPDPRWKKWYLEEESRLKRLLPPSAIKRISHIGSTSLMSISAKPIVDILLEANSLGDLPAIEAALIDNGYLEMHKGAHSIDFNRGYTPRGFAKKVFHLHLRLAGDNRELYFRDYLLDHPETAKEYEKLKLGLWKKYEHDRDAYTAAKTGFVTKVTDLAFAEYRGRYE